MEWDGPRVGKQGGIHRNGSTAAMRDDTQRLGSDLCGTSIIMTTYEIRLTGTLIILNMSFAMGEVGIFSHLNAMTSCPGIRVQSIYASLNEV
jgi:hypothetical protein